MTAIIDSSIWTRLPLGEVATIERRLVSPENIESGTTYVGLENIDGLGQFVGVREVTNGELASTKFCFSQSHILFGKLRPYLSKIARPPFEGICSTDILPILPGPKIDRSFLYHYLRLPAMVQLATSRCTGANLPRLSPSQLVDFEVPFPPLPEQRRVAAILDKAELLRNKRLKTLQLRNRVIQSVFESHFGEDYATANWRPLSEAVREFRYGTSIKSQGSGRPTLRIPNVLDGEVNLNDLKYVPVDDAEFQRLRLLTGDVLFVRTNGNPDYVGRCAVFDESEISHAGMNAAEFIYASYLIRARIDRDALDPTFLQHFLATPLGRRSMRDHCRTSAGQYNVNTEGLGQILIPMVPHDRQVGFSKAVNLMRAIYHRQSTHSDQCGSLFATLAERAYRGEL